MLSDSSEYPAENLLRSAETLIRAAPRVDSLKARSAGTRIEIGNYPLFAEEDQQIYRLSGPELKGNRSTLPILLHRLDESASNSSVPALLSMGALVRYFSDMTRQHGPESAESTLWLMVGRARLASNRPRARRERYSLMRHCSRRLLDDRPSMLDL